MTGLKSLLPDVQMNAAHHAAHGRRQNTNNTSGYKGVYLYKKTGRWRAKIGYDYRYVHLGYFDTAKEAAQAYKDAAIELYGEHARFDEP